MDKTDLIYQESNGNHDRQVIEHYITEQLSHEKVTVTQFLLQERDCKQFLEKVIF